MCVVNPKSEKEVIERNPDSGTFEVTLRCNLHCKMCLFRHADCENQKLRNEERTAKEWISMAREVAEAGTVSLLISGGEPMIREDFCELYEGIYKQGFVVELYTNATLVTPKIMETLRKYPPHTIGVTIYGACEETYEKVCGNGQAFYQAIAGMKQLATLPSRLDFRTTLIQDNVAEVEEMEALIHREIGEEHALIHSQNVYHAVRGGCAKADTVRLTPKENVELFMDREVQRIQASLGDIPFDKTRFHYISPQEEIKKMGNVDVMDTLFGCEGGVTSYAITYDGRLICCQMFDHYATNPFEEGFLPAWERFAEIVDPIQEPEECNGCKQKEYCSSCMAVRYAETGELSGIPSYICEEAQHLEEVLCHMRGGNVT